MKGGEHSWGRLVSSPGQAVKDGLAGARDFFTHRIWMARLRDLHRGKAFLYQASRLVYSTVKSWNCHALPFRAAALTYYTFLSIVPFLAFAFSILKGFGAYTRFVDETVRPYVHSTFGGNKAIIDQIDQLLGLVENTSFSNLGTFGLLALAYTAISLLSNVEVTLNELWGAKQKRPLVRQVTDYTTIVVTTPILILSAVAVAAMAKSSSIVVFLQDSLHIGPAIDFLFKGTQLFIAFIAMFAFYVLMPNVRTRLTSALLGAAVAGILWQLALVGYVNAQVGVARYNTLYATFGAIPIFLAWLYLSWLIVLVGAALAASHQNEQTVRQRLHARQADQGLKELLAIAAVARIARDFLVGRARPSATCLADAYEVPALTMDEILDALARAGVLARTVCGAEVGYVPGRDVDALRVQDVLHALRHTQEAEEVEGAVERHLGRGLAGLMKGLDEQAVQSPHNLTLRALAALVPEHARADEAAPPSTAAAPATPLDGKQPEVPA